MLISCIQSLNIRLNSQVLYMDVEPVGPAYLASLCEAFEGFLYILTVQAFHL